MLFFSSFELTSIHSSNNCPLSALTEIRGFGESITGVSCDLKKTHNRLVGADCSSHCGDGCWDKQVICGSYEVRNGLKSAARETTSSMCQTIMYLRKLIEVGY